MAAFQLKGTSQGMVRELSAKHVLPQSIPNSLASAGAWAKPGAWGKLVASLIVHSCELTRSPPPPRPPQLVCT